MNNPAEHFPDPAPAAPAPPPHAAHGGQPPAPTLSPAINDPRRKKPLLATVLSAMPGLGQVYVGYYQRGFVHAITVAVLITLLVSDLGGLTPLAAIFLAFFWLYNLVDAGRRAALYNQALAGGSEMELPDDFKAPDFGGSIAGGAALILIGLILLSHTLFGASLEWLEEWWPVALVGVGGWLLYKAIQERSSGESEPLE